MTAKAIIRVQRAGLALLLLVPTACGSGDISSDPVEGTTTVPDASPLAGEVADRLDEATKSADSAVPPGFTHHQPDITVAAGETVFANDLVTIVYTETTVDSISMDIWFETTNHTDTEFAIFTCDLMINTFPVGIGCGTKNFEPGRITEDVVSLWHRSLDDIGFTAEEIRTVQITFTITPIESANELFQGTALVEIE